jgi:endonuclease III
VLGRAGVEARELDYTKGDRSLWVRASCVALTSDCVAVGFQDITEAHRADEKLKLVTREYRHRLKNFIAHVYGGYGENLGGFLDRSVSTLREDLLSISGIGRETADSMVLYAAKKCTFVVDAYTYRVLLRHRLIEPEADYEAIKDLLESNLACDVELFNDFHAQFVAVGKTYCKPVARCEGCPLEQMPHDRHAGVENY